VILNGNSSQTKILNSFRETSKVAEYGETFQKLHLAFEGGVFPFVTRITYPATPPPPYSLQLLIFHPPRCLMSSHPSRREFLSNGLSAGLALPVLGAASAMGQQPTGKTRRRPRQARLPHTGPHRAQSHHGGHGMHDHLGPSVITRAADLGINYFDTARGYSHGNNERMVAAALGARRKQVIVSTKSHAPNKEELQKHLETSLRELNTDYIDIWYLHARNSPDEVPDDQIEVQ